MAALDAGYDVRSSAMTLDRFCGSGITSVNIAATNIMSGMEDMTIAGGTEMMSRFGTDAKSTRPSSTVAISACVKCTRNRIRAYAPMPPRLKALTAKRLTRWPMSANKSQTRHEEGRFDKSLVAVHKEDGSLALDKEEFPRPQTTPESLAELEPSFAKLADIPLDEDGTTFRKLVNQAYPDLKSITSTMPVIRPALSMAQPLCCWPRKIIPKPVA